MANVITQIDLMKYTGMDKAVFPPGTIVTPSARDWAKDHGLNIVIGESFESKKDDERDMLLKQVIKSVVENMNKAGGFLDKNEIVKVVAACMERLGCKVEEC